jgi:RNA polymerase sigma-70 factor (ECF subfamily)
MYRKPPAARRAASKTPSSRPRASEPASGVHLIPEPALLDFQDLYQKYFPLVWRTAKRLGVAPSALDDVCQEVFLAVYRQLHNYAGHSTVRTWVFGFILNVVQVHHRYQRRKNPYYRSAGELVDLETLMDRRAPADDTVLVAQAATIARDALSKMAESKQIPFVLADLEGFTASEISDTLGLNLNTVHSRIRAARSEFRRLVKRQRVGRELE